MEDSVPCTLEVTPVHVLEATLEASLWSTATCSC